MRISFAYPFSIYSDKLLNCCFASRCPGYILMLSLSAYPATAYLPFPRWHEMLTARWITACPY